MKVILTTNIKKIGKSSRQELIKIFEKEIHLFLYIKVKKNWTNNNDNFSDFEINNFLILILNKIITLKI